MRMTGLEEANASNQGLLVMPGSKPYEQVSVPGRIVTVGRGQEIYADGSPAEHMYRVIEGAVRLCKLMADGRRHITEFAVPGDLFGFNGCSEYLLSAEAVTDVKLVKSSCLVVNDLARRERAIADILQEITLHRLAAAQAQMLLLGRKTALERVASFLLDFAERTGATDCPSRLNLPMSRYDIADHLGLTVETVCRALSVLRRERVIRSEDPHHIVILNHDRLQELSESCDD